MSGPKGGSYQVETAAQRESRLLRDARADYATALSAWDSAAVLLAAAGVACGQKPSYLPPVPLAAGADSAAVHRATAELRAATSAALAEARVSRERVAARRAAACIARIRDHLETAAPEAAQVHPSAQQQPATSSTPPATTTVDRARVEQRVRRRLDELAELDHDASRVDDLISDIAAASSGSRIDLLMAELDLVVTDARSATARIRQIQAARADLVSLQARVAEVPGDSGERLRARIAHLIQGEATSVPIELPGLVDAAVEQADADADRLHVVTVMTAALRELGYSIGPEFSTHLSGADATGYARNGASRYGIKVRLEPGLNRFTAQAVKSDRALTSAQEDADAERQFCAALETVTALAKRDGVLLDVDIRNAPGDFNVQQVSDETLGAGTAEPGQVDTYADSFNEMEQSR